MKHHKDLGVLCLDVFTWKTLVSRKTLVCGGEKNETSLLSPRWHILENQAFPHRLCVRKEVALPWRLSLQSMGRTVCKKPSPGLTK